MKSMWRGAISFGLVNIAVRLYAATEEHDYRFRQVHRDDAGRIRYRRVCEECGAEVSYADMAKGYELADGRMVVLEAQDFEQLPVKTDRAIELLEFVPETQVDPILFQRSYYLEPEKQAVRPYVLLRRALEATGKLAVVKITLRQRETLATMRAREDVLVLHTMMWADEVRVPRFETLEDAPQVRTQELDMATSLIENMSGDFHPEGFVDDYQAALGELIEAKARGAELPSRSEPAGGGEVIDLMTALRRSVDETGGARSAKSGSGSGSGDGSRSASKSGRSKKSAPSERSGGAEDPAAGGDV